MEKFICMIPKTIHYCWFGGNSLPDLAVKCIESWKKYCPDYEIKEWNESNFDINCCRYVKEAYTKKRWAFVSDFARFKILYENGGLYFDTDVELIKSIDDLIAKGSFMGSEMDETGNSNYCNPGLGLAAEPKLEFFKKILDYYEGESFIDSNGEETLLDTVVVKTTRLLKIYGYEGSNSIEEVNGIRIYPPEFFCPKNYRTGELYITKNTRSIHHYTALWLNKREKQWSELELWIGKHWGVKFRTRLKTNVFWNSIASLYKYGVKRTIAKISIHLKKIYKFGEYK